MISRRIAAARITAGQSMPALDVECILSNEAFLVVRVPQAQAWAAEERYDGGSPVGKRYTVDELFRKVLAITAPSEMEHSMVNLAAPFPPRLASSSWRQATKASRWTTLSSYASVLTRMRSCSCCCRALRKRSRGVATML
jgi:hypothetical protein